MNKYYDYQRAVVLSVKEMIKQIADKVDGFTFYKACVQPNYEKSKYSGLACVQTGNKESEYFDFVSTVVAAWRQFCSQEFFEVNYSTDYVLAVKDSMEDAENVVFVCSKETAMKTEEVA
jgi:hypothetical protein